MLYTDNVNDDVDVDDVCSVNDDDRRLGPTSSFFPYASVPHSLTVLLLVDFLCTFIVVFGVSYCNCGPVTERESVVFYIVFFSSSAFIFSLFLLFVVCLLFCFDISTRQLCFFICLFSLTFVCQRCFFCLHRIFWFSIFVIPPLHFINYALFLSVHQRKWRENSNECYQITHCSLWLVWESLVFIFSILFYIYSN